MLRAREARRRGTERDELLPPSRGPAQIGATPELTLRAKLGPTALRGVALALRGRDAGQWPLLPPLSPDEPPELPEPLDPLCPVGGGFGLAGRFGGTLPFVELGPCWAILLILSILSFSDITSP